MNKKVILTFGMVLAAGALFARPHGGFGGPRGGFGGPRPAPMMHHHHHHHHGGFWGRGGRNFWPGFVGGVVGGVIADAVIGPTVVAPTVVTTPVVTTPVVTTPVVTTPVVTTSVYTPQQVWVPGGYVDQIQPNGTVVRVWQPGHYEMR